MSQHWDELASAHLDGEATPDEAARVEADPAGLAALEELRQVAEANADVPPPPSAVRDLHLGAALDLFDQLGTSAPVAAASTAARIEPTPGAEDANVVPFRRRRAAWLGSAAAAVVVAGIGVGLSRLDTSSSGGTTESADAAASPSASGERSGATALSDDAGDSDASADMATAMADSEADAGSAETEAMEDAVDTFSAAELPSTTAANAESTVEIELEPVAELTAADDLLEVTDQLIADDLMSADPNTDLGRQLAFRQTRCPSDFEGFDVPLAAPVIFDDEPAFLVFSSSPIDRMMVITRDCMVLAAVQRS